MNVSFGKFLGFAIITDRDGIIEDFKNTVSGGLPFTEHVVEVVELAIDIFNKDHITFKFSSKKIQANFDRTQLIRVITNLLKNAFQAIPEDRTPDIKVSISEKDDNVNISISDNGYGISKTDTEKIFEPSFTTKSSGMGLGLSMIKSIITAYNGNITFSSKSNVGTTFNINFPKN